MLLAYKEADNLRKLLPEIKTNIEKCVGNNTYEIVVVDTHEPTDDTSLVCDQFGARYINQEGPGFGGAFRTAIKSARMDKFLIMDSDGSHPPRYIPDIYKMFSTGEYDVVIGSRYVAGGISNDTPSSRVMSHLLNFAYRIVIGVKAKDLSTDYRIYHTDELKKVHLECLNYDVLEEVILKLKINKKPERFLIGETPIHFEKRQYGESKRQLVPFIISYIKTLFRLLWIRISFGSIRIRKNQ